MLHFFNRSGLQRKLRIRHSRKWSWPVCRQSCGQRKTAKIFAGKKFWKTRKTPQNHTVLRCFWWRLLDSNQWPPACERIGKTFSDRFQPNPTQKNPHSKLSNHRLPRRVRSFRTALWLFMWSNRFPPDEPIRGEAVFLFAVYLWTEN